MRPYFWGEVVQPLAALEEKMVVRAPMDPVCVLGEMIDSKSRIDKLERQFRTQASALIGDFL